jgi:undecaprenyl phosphate N,N'-diacetylbacillosamine 1-phosphate transferase
MLQCRVRMGEKQVGRAVKRGIDAAVSFLGLLLLAVPFGVIALAIVIDDAGPVLFRQERAGKRGRRFRVWKFRTMIVGAVSKGLGHTVSRDDARITKVGRVLRNWGLDELPQLINVLTGSMSLVGPRPTFLYQVEHYDDFQRRRLGVRPGITSLAVVSGRNVLPWRKRIELDVWYIDHWSLWLDVKILFRTLWCVLVTREGLYGDDGVNDPFVSLDRPPDVGRREDR